MYKALVVYVLPKVNHICNVLVVSSYDIPSPHQLHPAEIGDMVIWTQALSSNVLSTVVGARLITPERGHAFVAQATATTVTVTVSSGNSWVLASLYESN